MKQNIKNVLWTFALIALTSYGGALVNNSLSTRETLLTHQVETSQLAAEDKLQEILTDREQKITTEVVLAQKVATVADAKAQIKKENIDLAAAAADKRQADLVAAQKAAEVAAQNAAQARIAKQKAAELAAAQAAAKMSSRRSRAS